MIAASQFKVPVHSVRLRPIALPTEHGGWGLLFEPILLGLLLAPSIAGLFFSVAATGAFLARHPFKLAIGDWRRARRLARTAVALRFAISYSSIALVGLALALKTSVADFSLPLLLAAPIAGVQLFYDSSGRSRTLIAELAGSISIGAVATAIALAGNWPRGAAFGLWVILAARNVPTILYLRARLKILHHKTASSRPVIAAHLVAIAVVVALALVEAAPFLAVVAMVILLSRAVVGLWRSDRQVAAKKLGLCEVAFGAMTVIAVVLGHVGGW